MAGEKKKRQGPKRWAHLNSFFMEEDGSYGYHGAVYAYDGPEKSRKAFLLALWLLAALVAGAVIFAGCIPAPGMDNCFYVLLPYLGEVTAAGSLVWGLSRMTAGGDPLRAYVFEATVEKLPRRAAATMIFAGIGAIGCIIFLLCQVFAGPIWTIIGFFGLKLLVIVSAFMIKCKMVSAKWRKQIDWLEEETA